MKIPLGQSFFVACVALVAATVAIAGEPTGFRADLLGQIEYVQKQIMSLEDATPQDKFTWRPADGVRSIGEVYNHIAFGNYGLMSIAGYEAPADAGWSMEPEKWDKATIDKKEIAERLAKSFQHVKSTVTKISDSDLEKDVDFFGNKMTLRSALMSELSHLHEHLGQSIAYARMNGIVPPWTAAEQARAKETSK